MQTYLQEAKKKKIQFTAIGEVVKIKIKYIHIVLYMH